MFFFPLSSVLLLLFSNGKIHSWQWQVDCLEKFRGLQFLPRERCSHNLQLHADMWPDSCCILGTVSRFATMGLFPWQLPVKRNKTPDAAWEQTMLLAPALVHKQFIACFAYLCSLVMRTVQNACLKSVQSLSLSVDTGWILRIVLNDFPSALHMPSLHF